MTQYSGSTNPNRYLFLVRQVTGVTTMHGTRLTLYGTRLGFGDYYAVGINYEHDLPLEELPALFVDAIPEHYISLGVIELHQIDAYLKPHAESFRLFKQLELGQLYYLSESPLVLV